MDKKTLTVLLIDDDPEYSALVQRWLALQRDIEFVVNRTDSLRAGLHRLVQGGVDVILLDLGLPGSKGLETFTTARMQASGIPIVVLSGSDTESLALEMVRRGSQDYLVKSACDGETLAKALQYAVARSTLVTVNFSQHLHSAA